MLSACPPVDIWSGCKGVVLISTCVCLYSFEYPFSLLLGIFLGVVGGPLVSVFTFCGTIHLLQWLDRLAVPSALHKDSSFSRASPKFVISCFCFCNLKILVLWVGVVVLVCISPMTNGAAHAFVLVGHFHIMFWRFVCSSPLPVLNWVICLSLLFSCRTVDLYQWSDLAGIFSSSVDYLFNSLIMLFVTFHFDEVHFHTFFFFFPSLVLVGKAVTGESTLELGNLRSGPSFNAHCFFLSI